MFVSPKISFAHLSQSGFALEEVCVFAALWRVEFGVEERTAVGNGLQGGRSLVGEGQTHKQLQWRENLEDTKMISLHMHVIFNQNQERG